jgi:uncharacterized iron-regulated membrane protein
MAWPDVVRAARINVLAEGRKRGFAVERERAFWIDRENGNHTYVIRTDRDKSADGANSYFGIDGRTGAITSVTLPTGDGATVDYWLAVLHVAGVGGLAFRILVSMTGVLIVLLSITGLVIWAKKRAARAFVRTMRYRPRAQTVVVAQTAE